VVTALSRTLAALEAIAPIHLAEEWDNVGLLLEPRSDDPGISKVFFTIDLTDAVYAEAVAYGAELVVTYHPIIFGGLKRLTQADPLTRILLDAAARRVTIYSPHTALDAVVGGVNDWLLAGVGACGEVAPITPTASALPADAGAGAGRRGVLTAPATLEVIAARLKAHLDLAFLRVAAAPIHAHLPVSTVAVCPGAGGGLFAAVGEVDLLVTGEMRHHDVLARVARGTSVILTDHTNCERGYLEQYAKRLMEAVGGAVDARVSSVDADPLTVR
jgi:dinuclear metal center YbgI/SA1388 family protein